mmetsp:Transcript_31110/g.71698  ORF Transcript_31110/g.71698 Transcript_31110/m.71698 type:complete len:345 (-) Transcript_31110:152-1186(-)
MGGPLETHGLSPSVRSYSRICSFVKETCRTSPRPTGRSAEATSCSFLRMDFSGRSPRLGTLVLRANTGRGRGPVPLGNGTGEDDRSRFANLALRAEADSSSSSFPRCSSLSNEESSPLLSLSSSELLLESTLRMLLSIIFTRSLFPRFFADFALGRAIALLVVLSPGRFSSTQETRLSLARSPLTGLVFGIVIDAFLLFSEVIETSSHLWRGTDVFLLFCSSSMKVIATLALSSSFFAPASERLPHDVKLSRRDALLIRPKSRGPFRALALLATEESFGSASIALSAPLRGPRPRVRPLRKPLDSLLWRSPLFEWSKWTWLLLRNIPRILRRPFCSSSCSCSLL